MFGETCEEWYTVPTAILRDPSGVMSTSLEKLRPHSHLIHPAVPYTFTSLKSLCQVHHVSASSMIKGWRFTLVGFVQPTPTSGYSNHEPIRVPSGAAVRAETGLDPRCK
jgi:hypothetical protein